MFEFIKIGRIPVHIFTEDSLHDEIARIIRNNEKKNILHANAHLVQLANSKEPWLINYFNNEVDYVFCDGSGIQLGARLTGQKIPQKITYNVWFWNFARFCSENNYSIFLLGAREEVAQLAAERLKEKSPGLNIHFHHGYFNKETSSPENEEVIAKINKIKPNVLVVCFGMPVQEKYVKRNFERLNANIFLTGGGALDFFSGKAKTAPSLISKIYLEWLYRLYHDPKRLWKRYLFGNIRFFYYLFRYGKK